MRHLLLNLEAPLMAFGGETIDNYGVIRDFPAASMLTGLMANALGWRRIERERHQRLQERLVFAARIDREPAGGVRLTDYQTALLYEDDAGWTTRGQPEGRNKSSSYQPVPPDNRRALTWQRYRHYFADMCVTVVLRLKPAADGDGPRPTLDDLAAALDEPQRPLFIGRKPCLPSGRLCQGFREGSTALAALMGLPIDESTRSADEREQVRLFWPVGEEVDSETAKKYRLKVNRTFQLTDERNWVSGLHGGGRLVCDGTAPVGAFGQPAGAREEAQP